MNPYRVATESPPTKNYLIYDSFLELRRLHECSESIALLPILGSVCCNGCGNVIRLDIPVSLWMKDSGMKSFAPTFKEAE